jgi:predicted helicase
LGLDAKTAVKIKEIKQLRPLASNQPWGIFFVNFEPKRLPVVVLRRILRSLVIKKRQSANKPQQAAWQLHDLLFISAYGESEHRDITLANFSEGDDKGDLPTLKVLGWDDEDTVRHLAYSHEILKEKLHWPDNPADLENWRHTWSQAFTLKHREVIGTSKQMAERMAELATAIRKRVNNVLAVESEKGPMRKLMTAFREALIHDLKPDDFADMYAQTITYGLLSARVSRPAGLVADNIRDMVPITNPFLRDLLSTFLTVGGRKGKVDFDELGINDVVQALRDANMEAVIRDFDDKNPDEDPVIHFYEDFLKEYDAERRTKRGVFYTPRAVVSFIVRSVDEILRKDFGLEDGLADTTTWGEMAKRKKGLKIPEDIKPDQPFVQILDPACGTGTFLVEVIDLIHRTMMMKWRKQRHMELELDGLWNSYVADHLLPRLYGIELMMAPYAIAHMKIGLKLGETRYNFRAHERARVYLTNSLEEPKDFSDRFEFDAPALAHEAHAVNAVKRGVRFTAIIGNPPYAGHSANASWEVKDDRTVPTFIGRLVQDYYQVDGKPLGEKNPKWLQDDYVKFLRFGQWTLQQSGCGVLSMISNHGYLDNPTFRGMRQQFVNDFSKTFVLDLHGNSKKQEKSPDGSKDENVFDIQQGVAIGAFIKTGSIGNCTVSHAGLWGIRDAPGGKQGKYAWLWSHDVTTAKWSALSPYSPFYLFVPEDTGLRAEYDQYCKITELMPVNVLGFQSHRDEFAVSFEEAIIRKRINDLRSAEVSDNEVRSRYGLTDNRDWHLHDARKRVRSDPQWQRQLIRCLYRPFDWRHCYFSTVAMDYPRRELLDHVAGRVNLCLNTVRQTKMEAWAHAVVSNCPTPAVFVELKDGSNLFPLYLYDSERSGDQRALGHGKASTKTPNIGGSNFVGGEPERVFAYVYAIFYSPTYQKRYVQFLKSDFPRLPVTPKPDVFASLADLGTELVALHLMESPKLEKYITKYVGKGASEVAPGYPRFVSGGEAALDCGREAAALGSNGKPGSAVDGGARDSTDKSGSFAAAVQSASRTGKVQINPQCWFEGVPENVWNFHIGGYQVCEKWLKDRRGRVLSEEDIAHYQKIVVALKETIRLMAEIDKVIEAHGGWPGAFLKS